MGVNAVVMVKNSNFKTLLVVERLAGGPVLVDNDVLTRKLPRYAESALYDDIDASPEAEDEDFFLPGPLDGLMPNWRLAENYPVEKPYMVF